MPCCNHVIVMGHLTRNPELRSNASGLQIADFCVAVSEKRKDGKDEVSFIQCNAFGNTAQALCRIANKGFCVLVEGKLKQDRWQDRQSGQNKEKMKILANSVVFVSSSGGNKEQSPEPYSETTKSYPPAPEIQQGEDEDIPF